MALHQLKRLIAAVLRFELTLAVVALGIATPIAAFATEDPVRAGPSEVITLHFRENPPFSHGTPDGRIVGLLVSPTLRAFEMAGIPIVSTITPIPRILQTLKNNSGLDCSPGWYSTADRQTFARFSLPIYTDKPLVGLVRSSFDVKPGVKVSELLAKPGIRLAVKIGFTLGPVIEEIVKRMPSNQIRSVASDIPTMIQMVAHDRADLIIMAEEEVSVLITEAGLSPDDFQVLRFPDAATGFNRYVICSLEVPDRIMRSLDDAIRILSSGTSNRP